MSEPVDPNAPVNRSEIDRLIIQRDLAEQERLKLLRESKNNNWQIGVLIASVILVGLEVWILAKQSGIMIQQDQTMKSQTSIMERQTRHDSIQADLMIGQNQMMAAQNELLLGQNEMIETQNELFEIQNERVEQQNKLIESQRRSSYVFLMGNIMDAVNNELNDVNNSERVLSTELMGQIISLSNSLIPYTFIMGDSLITRPLSPERGMLLNFLLESSINCESLNMILHSASFESSYADKLLIVSDTITSLNLSNSTFNDVRIHWSQIDFFKCRDCIIDALYTFESDIAETFIRIPSKMHELSLNSSTLLGCHFIVDEVGIFGTYEITGRNLELLTYTLDSCSIRDCMLEDVNIEASNIDRMYITNSLLWYFAVNDPNDRSWQSKRYGSKRSTKDYSFTTIRHLQIDDSCIAQMGSLSRIDRLNVNSSALANTLEYLASVNFISASDVA